MPKHVGVNGNILGTIARYLSESQDVAGISSVQNLQCVRYRFLLISTIDAAPLSRSAHARRPEIAWPRGLRTLVSFDGPEK